MLLMIIFNDDETQQYLLMNCYRAQEVWDKLKAVGVNFNLCYNSVMYCIIDDKLPSKHTKPIQLIICIVCSNLCKTRCAMIIRQTVIDSETVFKQILTDPRRRTMDKSQHLPRNILSL